MYLDEFETMTTRDEEIPTPKFALPRVHDILFVIGGMGKYWSVKGYFECYSTPADRWTKVIGTQIHSYCALLSNYMGPLNSILFSGCTQHYITQFQFILSLVILLKNNIHNLYLQHYYNKNFFTLCKSKVKLSRYHNADKGGRIHT
jgi:hypothetical protein